MTLPILVENYEVFAKLNYLIDLVVETNQELDLTLNSTRNC
jgi:hypothetical protein